MPIDQEFLRLAHTAFNPYNSASGTEHVAYLLHSLVRMTRPRSVIEYGSGYTTLFLLSALADNGRDVAEERASLQAKTAEAGDLAENVVSEEPRLLDWFFAGGKAWGVDPGFYLKPYEPHLFSFEALEGAHEYTQRMRDAVAELGFGDLLTHLTGTRPSLESLPQSAFPIGLAWNDARDYQTFFETLWPHLNPCGGLMVFHNTTAFRQSWDQIQWMKEARRHAGDLEVLTLQEPQKLDQASCTILRRTSEFRPRFLSKDLVPEVAAALRCFRESETAPGGTPVPRDGP